MPSNDARTLLHAAVPTLATGAVGAVVGGVVAGGEGAVGAVLGTVLVVVFMGLGMFVLQRTAKSLPHLFQAMGLMLYTTQMLLLFVVMTLLKDTTLFDFKAFGFTLLAATIVWVAAQARHYMKAKILYVDPASDNGGRTAKTGSAT
ncbi:MULTISPECIES: hypothetical protein [Streptomyces]|uniref:ATP synthase protein I n=1 Tax=Streptomyces sudanensis TaxID=436397 RepID=A0ABY4TBZ0_9ACTN|nr:MULTISPECIES: hypothetical protein [Streptomyces]MCP9957263.1 hypothetical protein [Streptomyces sudanensis]MCP9986418.1 hypothetical protein [Streptomyces sudanensis]MCQ0002176.1 hypothetical protein [Streptomyces sudanensis]URN14956.1 hypothetical protein MW084_02315 [Streptomyces sudanensis]